MQIRIKRSTPPPPVPTSVDMISCGLRIIRVSDATGIANASGHARPSTLEALATAIAEKLKQGMLLKGESVAVVSLRNRTGTERAKAVCEELADKVQGALIETGWFDVKERIDLRPIVDETKLDQAGVVRNEHVRRKLTGVKYIVIGGLTLAEPPRP